MRKEWRGCAAASNGRHRQLARVLVISLLGMLMLVSDALATWAVIAVDRRTGRVVVASATCVPQAGLERFPAAELRDIQAIVVPGKAVAVAQVGADPEDAVGESFYDGDYALYISVTDQDIQPHENGNPVTTLRSRA